MCKCGRLQTAVPSWGLLGAGPRWQFGVADAGTPNYTLPAGSSAVCRAGRHRFCWLRGFWQCLELCFGSGAAVPWSPGVALLRGVTLLSEWENQQFPSSRLFPFWASPVGQVWSVEIRGHGALLGSGACFSHRVFPPGMAEGCWALLPVGTQALFQLSWCWAMGGEAGQARKTTSGEVSRPLGVCRKCCRAGISCSRPWVAGNKQQGAHLEPPPTHTRGGSSSPGAFPEPGAVQGMWGWSRNPPGLFLGAVAFAPGCWKVQEGAACPGDSLLELSSTPGMVLGEPQSSSQGCTSRQTLGYSLGSSAMGGEAHAGSSLRAEGCSSPAQNVGTPNQPCGRRTEHIGAEKCWVGRGEPGAGCRDVPAGWEQPVLPVLPGSGKSPELLDEG